MIDTNHPKAVSDVSDAFLNQVQRLVGKRARVWQRGASLLFVSPAQEVLGQYHCVHSTFEVEITVVVDPFEPSALNQVADDAWDYLASSGLKEQWEVAGFSFCPEAELSEVRGLCNPRVVFPAFLWRPKKKIMLCDVLSVLEQTERLERFLSVPIC